MIQNKRYKVILADPPWSYNDRGSKRHPGAEQKYECMSLQRLRDLRVEKLADKDCALFMWTTMPFLQDALSTMFAWGFKYKTVAFVWVKRNKKKPDGWFWGMGNWTRANAELVLLGVRGKPKRRRPNVHSVVEAPVGAHSAKPAEVHDRITVLCGAVPRVELFARQKRTGWDAIGLGIDGRRIEDVLREGTCNES